MSTTNSTSETLSQWARRLAQGDTQAYQQLYDEYAPRVLSYLNPRCRGRLSADDIAQEVWLRVWAKHDTFDGQNFQGWLFQIAHNCLVNAYRKQQPELLADGFDVAGPVSALEKEDLTELEDCLLRVGGLGAEMLNRFYRGESYESIAQRMEIPVGTVGSRLHRAKSQVRECMKKKFPERFDSVDREDRATESNTE